MKHFNIKHIFGPVFSTVDAVVGRSGYRKSETKPGFLLWLPTLGQLRLSYNHVWQPVWHKAGGQEAFDPPTSPTLDVVDALDERFYLLCLPQWFSPSLKICVGQCEPPENDSHQPHTDIPSRQVSEIEAPLSMTPRGLTAKHSSASGVPVMHPQPRNV